MERIELTNRLRKMIAGLGQVKNRRVENLFVAEGVRCVMEILGGALRCPYLVATHEWVDANAGAIERRVEQLVAVSPAEMARLSQQKSPQPVLALFEIPNLALEMERYKRGLFMALDKVQDPGNLGTIVRLADWFGITDIFCSHDTVDVFNPKVVQATMGAITRVRLHYVVSLSKFLEQLDIPVYGTFLDGENLYSATLSESGVIVMGNEGNGISEDVAATVSSRLLIPTYPPARDAVESLNVGVAASIVVSEFRRRQR